MISKLLGAVWLLSLHLLAAGAEDSRETLVLVDNSDVRDTHSRFFASLAGRGHHLTFHAANSPDVVLYKHGQWLYDNLIVFAPRAEEFATLDVAGVAAYVEAGGNLLVAVDQDMSDLMLDLAGEFGIDFDRKRGRVVDHFSYEPSLDRGLEHTAIVTRAAIANSQVLGPLGGEGRQPRVAYSGVAHTVDADNTLVLKVLMGEPTAYSGSQGQVPLLVSAVQARNNARAVFSGSLDLFGDRFMGTGADNAAFASELSKWALGERGVLRASNVTHHREDGGQPEHLLAEKVKPDLPFSLFPDPELNRQSLVYRIKDDIVYSLVIEEYDREQGGWRPYRADDVQLEFVMLDPYLRTFMKHDGNGRYSAHFKVPDVYGVYKFRVLYRRPGYTTLAVNTQVSIRPFHHDEYERFILQAYPYYTSALSMMAGFLVFGVAFLYSRDSGANKPKSS